MQCNGHYAVQGHSRSPILVPIESSYTTSWAADCPVIINIIIIIYLKGTHLMIMMMTMCSCSSILDGDYHKPARKT